MGDEFLRHKLFHPFSQENNLTLGTGLGLSVVHRIVKMLGGTITVKSRVGAGTVVAVSLPVFPPYEERVEDGEFPAQVAALSGLRVDLSRVDASLELTDAIPTPSQLGSISELGLLEIMCRDWLKMEIINSQTSELKADLMIRSDIATEESGKDASTSISPPTVVICRTAVTAHDYASSFVPTRRLPIVEFVSRP